MSQEVKSTSSIRPLDGLITQLQEAPVTEGVRDASVTVDKEQDVTVR